MSDDGGVKGCMAAVGEAAVGEAAVDEAAVGETAVETAAVHYLSDRLTAAVAS